ncbi:MAG: hypothetical protein A2W98_06750 [Bacteroidetes bacterium GWF2_33_38]|nr:MAG: hypothetical protein A2W98_06750 [Bacteroidetes bacterium GWF2_33_38]OFY75047.1 MAG: hypothetical protein A2265_12165 [Bacteroidetes bacterium RIFOXYA12_FULL_33_9]
MHVGMSLLFFAVVGILSSNRPKYTPKIWFKKQNFVCKSNRSDKSEWCERCTPSEFIGGAISYITF